MSRKPSPSSGSPSLSVAICTGNRPQELRRCLDSLREQTLPPDEIIIVWSGYTLPKVPEDLDIDVVALAVSQRGLSIARNAALDAATSEIVAFLDDDAVAEPQWCEVLRACFADAAVGAVCGPVLPLNQDSEYRDLPASAHTLFKEARTVTRADEDWFPLIHFGGFVGGTNMAVRRASVPKSLFHPALGRGAPIEGGEEQYAFHQIVEHGHSVRHDPRAVVRHPIPASAEEIAFEAYSRQRNGVSYLGFIFLNNRTARRALPRWFLHRGFRKSRGFVGVGNARRLAMRSRLDGLADLMRWILS